MVVKVSRLVGLCLASAVLLASGAACAEVADSSLLAEAHAKYDAGQLDQAEVLFARLLERFPSSSLAPDAQYYLGWIAHKKNTGKAEARWQAVVDRYPKSPEAPKALMGIAAVHYKASAPKEARLTDFEKVVLLYPRSPEAEEAWFRIGSLHNRIPPDFDKSLAAFQYLVENATNPKWQAEAYVQIGFTYLQRYWHEGRKNPGDLDWAMNVFSSARTVFPDQGDAVARGELRQVKRYLYSERDPVKARQALNEILRAYPETSSTTEIFYQIAYCSFAEKDYLTCIQLCERIIVERPPSDWNCYLQYFIGNCYLQADRKADAKAAFEETMRLYPGTNWAKNAEGVLSTLNFEEEVVP